MFEVLFQLANLQIVTSSKTGVKSISLKHLCLKKKRRRRRSLNCSGFKIVWDLSSTIFNFHFFAFLCKVFFNVLKKKNGACPPPHTKCLFFPPKFTIPVCKHPNNCFYIRARVSPNDKNGLFWWRKIYSVLVM